MASVYGVDELNEDAFYQLVVAFEDALLGKKLEQVPSCTEVHDEIYVGLLIDDTVESDDVTMT